MTDAELYMLIESALRGAEVLSAGTPVASLMNVSTVEATAAEGDGLFHQRGRPESGRIVDHEP